MTEDEALERVAQLPDDPEIAHSYGDDIAWDALRELGWNRLADALELAAKKWWYA